jgi:hypothetical protein
VDERGRRRAGFGIEVFNELTAGRYVSLARSDLSRLLFDEVKDLTRFRSASCRTLAKT